MGLYGTSEGRKARKSNREWVLAVSMQLPPGRPRHIANPLLPSHNKSPTLSCQCPTLNRHFTSHASQNPHKAGRRFEPRHGNIRIGFTRPPRVGSLEVSKPSDMHLASSSLSILTLGSTGSLEATIFERLNCHSCLLDAHHLHHWF